MPLKTDATPTLFAEGTARLGCETLQLDGASGGGADLSFGFLSTGGSAAAPPAIPGYEILRTLGRGGMGIVYLARQPQLNRLVALKMILAGHDARPEDLERFQAEAQAIARLQHPNIVQLHDLGQFQGRPYFSLEYVAGGSLAERLAGKPQPPRQAAELVETLARAMQHAHSQGIVHRDLKPANVLLGEPSASAGGSSPKITDFGLARLMHRDSRLTRSGDVVGTPSYMAPEQAQGKLEEMGPSVDIYALGAILYELLTGRPPFQGVTPVETILLAATCEPASPSVFQPRLPRDLQTICLKCLQKEPAKRYRSAAELADDLRRFLDDRPILARPLGRIEKTMRWSRRNPALAGSLAALAFVLVAGLASVTGLWLYAEAKRGDAVRNEQAAQAALKLAEQREAEAKAANAAAERNLDRALRAIDQTLVKFAQLEQAKLPQFEPERIAILEGALKILNEALKENVDSVEARRQTTEVCRRVAEIYRQLSRLPECEAAYNKGLELCRELAKEQPGSAQAQLSLCVMLTGMAGFRAKQFRPEDAAELQAEALRAAEAVAAHQLPDGFNRYDVGFARQNLGAYMLECGKAKESLPHLRRGVEEMQAALAQETKAERKALLTRALAALARCQSELGMKKEGDASFRAAIQLAEELANAHPDDFGLKYNLSGVAGDYGTYLSFIPHDEEALKRFEQSRRLILEVAAAQPNRPDLPSFAARALMNAAIIHMRRQDADQGAAACREANAINEKLSKAYPHVAEYQANLARGLQLEAIFLAQQGSITEARGSVLRALTIAEDQAKQFGNKPHIALLPAQLQVHLMELELGAENPSAAAGHLDRALKLLADLRRRFPADTVIRDQEAGAKQAKLHLKTLMNQKPSDKR